MAEGGVSPENAGGVVEKPAGIHAKDYEKAAKAVMERTGGDLKVRGGDFLGVDGTAFVRTSDIAEYEKRMKEGGYYGGGIHQSNLEGRIERHDSQNIPRDAGDPSITRVSLVGRYGSNNGLVQFVDAEGKMHAGVETKENLKALADAGYEQGGTFPVILSVAEIEFVNPANKTGAKYLIEQEGQRVQDINTAWTEMNQRGVAKLAEEREARQQAQKAA